MAYIRVVVLIGLLATLLWALNRSWGSIPPIAPLLDPFQGVWHNASSTDLPSGELTISGLQGEVTIHFDDRGVPHIFAGYNEDLYFAQGYVMARDRLWQMDFLTRAASGRLSEVLGTRALEYDRYQRRMGMLSTAERLVDVYNANDTTRMMNASFTAGINAWVNQLSAGDYPFEFKMLGYAPEEWSTLKTALIFMNIRMDLSGSSNEHRMLNTRMAKGDAFMEMFFGNNQDWVDPIVPRGTEWSFDVDLITPPDSFFTPRFLSGDPPFQPDPANGSNNWALSGSKTASRRPLLSNDPHLGLNLPSIWYESQLISPDVNVYGVSLVGSPGITIGFNSNIAWGLTNTGSDVLDWLEITWKDSTRSSYLYDGNWRESIIRTEIIKVKGQEDVVDTVYYTHHGPVVLYDQESAFNVQSPVEHALLWTGHTESNEVLTIFKMNRSANAVELIDAISHFRAPTQNVVFADSDGNIGIISNGNLPIKWVEQGKYPGDGSDPRYSWRGYIPNDQLPQIINPARGFVSSANQHPAAPDEYPFYLDYAFATYERGTRINNRLEAMTAATPDSMFALLNDSYSMHAASITPRMVDGIRNWQTDSIDTKPYINLMHEWDFYHEPDQGAAALFQRWWAELQSAIWPDEFPQGVPVTWPSRDVMVKSLLSQPDGEWIDDKRTPEVESLDDILRISFVKAVRFIETQQGKDPSTWNWVKSQNANVSHLLGLQQFGVTDILAGGCSECVNAFRNGHGPSWKMVVSLEDEVKAWGVYPGGQSGNPASPNFSSMLSTWESGDLYPLLYMKSASDQSDRITSVFTIKP